MQILKDIYMVSGNVYGTDANVYVIDVGKELVLIDSGLSENYIERIKSTLSYWGLEKKPITHAFFTHCHFDHAGNAAYFEKHGAVLYAEKNDAEAMMNGDDRTLGYAFNGLVFPCCKKVKVIGGGDKIPIGNICITVIPVPGHTKGSLLFYCEKDGKRVLFVGDFMTVKGNCDDAVLGWNGSPDYDAESYLKSTKMVKDRVLADVLLCGHGIPCLKEGYRLLNMLYKEALVNLR